MVNYLISYTITLIPCHLFMIFLNTICTFLYDGTLGKSVNSNTVSMVQRIETVQTRQIQIAVRTRRKQHPNWTAAVADKINFICESARCERLWSWPCLLTFQSHRSKGSCSGEFQAEALRRFQEYLSKPTFPLAFTTRMIRRWFARYNLCQLPVYCWGKCFCGDVGNISHAPIQIQGGIVALRQVSVYQLWGYWNCFSGSCNCCSRL